jgi:hypothetical protein
MMKISQARPSPAQPRNNSARVPYTGLRRAGCFLLILILLCGAAHAESKTEADLRARLAASEAAHASAMRDKADLAAALAKLTAQGSAQTARAAIASTQRSDASSAAALNASEASDTAQANAAASQATAQSNALIAQQAAAAASVAAASALKANANGNEALLITQLFIFLGGVAAYFYTAWTATRERRWKHEDDDRERAVTAVHRADLLKQIGDVKHEANKAYSEANSVNVKLENIGVKMANGLPLNPHEH